MSSRIVSVDDFEQTQDYAAWKVLTSTFGADNQLHCMRQPAVAARRYKWTWGAMEADSLQKLLDLDHAMLPARSGELKLLEQWRPAAPVAALPRRGGAVGGGAGAAPVESDPMVCAVFPHLLQLPAAELATKHPMDGEEQLLLSIEELGTVANVSFGSHNMFTIAALRNDRRLADALVQLVATTAGGGGNNAVELETITSPLRFRGRTFLNTLAWYGHYDLLFHLLKQYLKQSTTTGGSGAVAAVGTPSSLHKKQTRNGSGGGATAPVAAPKPLTPAAKELLELLFDVNAIDSLGLDLRQSMVQGFLCRVHHGVYNEGGAKGSGSGVGNSRRKMAVEDVCRECHTIVTTHDQLEGMRNRFHPHNTTATAAEATPAENGDATAGTPADEVAPVVEAAQPAGGLLPPAVVAGELLLGEASRMFDAFSLISRIIQMRKRRSSASAASSTAARNARMHRDEEEDAEELSGAELKKKMKRFEVHAKRPRTAVIDGDDAPALVPALVVGGDCIS